jgi:hypothetical protein
MNIPSSHPLRSFTFVANEHSATDVAHCPFAQRMGIVSSHNGGVHSLFLGLMHVPSAQRNGLSG